MEPAGLYGIDQWRVTALTLFSILLTAEIGRWVGRRGRRRSPESAGARVEVFEGALLGLLSLMIGFTFSLALNRFEQRKEVVLNEANAIGTVVLRARLLPDAQAAEAGRAAREYAQTRLQLGYAAYASESWARAIARSAVLQEAMWMPALAATTLDPRSVPAGLYAEAVNHLYDMHEARVTADRNHVPEAALYLLYVIAAVALGFAGYASARAGTHNRMAIAIMAMIVVAVIMLIMDLDRPRRGFVTVSQQPMRDLIAGFSSASGGAPQSRPVLPVEKKARGDVPRP